MARGRTWPEALNSTTRTVLSGRPVPAADPYCSHVVLISFLNCFSGSSRSTGGPWRTSPGSPSGGPGTATGSNPNPVPPVPGAYGNAAGRSPRATTSTPRASLLGSSEWVRCPIFTSTMFSLQAQHPLSPSWKRGGGQAGAVSSPASGSRGVIAKTTWWCGGPGRGHPRRSLCSNISFAYPC